MRVIQISVLTIMPLIGSFLLIGGNIVFGAGVLIAWMVFIGFITALMFTSI